MNIFVQIVNKFRDFRNKRLEKEEKEFKLISEEKKKRFREETTNIDLMRLEDDFNF